jgi:hypothetical protein
MHFCHCSRSQMMPYSILSCHFPDCRTSIFSDKPMILPLFLSTESTHMQTIWGRFVTSVFPFLKCISHCLILPAPMQKLPHVCWSHEWISESGISSLTRNSITVCCWNMSSPATFLHWNINMWQVQVMWLYCTTAWHLSVIKQRPCLPEYASWKNSAYNFLRQLTAHLKGKLWVMYYVPVPQSHSALYQWGRNQ